MNEIKRNPFTPSFGVAPLVLAGRDLLVSDLVNALDNWPGDPSLSTILVGARGTGKTSVLTVVSQEASARGWLSANVSAEEGMLEDIFERTIESANQFVERKSPMRVKSVNIGGIFGAEWEYRNPESGNWRTRMNKVLDSLAEHDVGLLITVDEVRSDCQEMVQLASVYQHFVRENRKVALLMAGLPDNVEQLVDDKSVSFLRRASRRYLGRVGNEEVKNAALRTIEAGGRTVGEAALAKFAEAAEGFPYMIQLVGFRAWAQNPAGDEVTEEDVRRGALLAQEEMNRQILGPTWALLSKGDQAFMKTLVALGGSASLAAISKQLGKASNYTSKYKSRLIEKGVVQTADGGGLEFSLPGLREYIEQETRDET